MKFKFAVYLKDLADSGTVVFSVMEYTKRVCVTKWQCRNGCGARPGSALSFGSEEIRK